MNKLKQMHFALFLTGITSLCFAFPAVFIKLLMGELSPIGTLTIRFFIAAALFPVIVMFVKKSKLKAILHAKGDELKEFCIYGFLLFASIAALFSSFLYIHANKAMLIYMMYPLFDGILAWIILKEKITKTDSAAMVCTIIGAYFIFGMNSTGEGSIMGYALATTGTLLFAGYSIFSREVGRCYEYYKRTAWLFIFCFFFFMIAFFITGNPKTLLSLKPMSWVWLLLFGIGSTLIPYMCLSYASAYIKSSVISVILVGGNVIGIGLVSWIFHEPITIPMIVGTGFILIGFLITTITEWKEEEEKYHHVCHH